MVQNTSMSHLYPKTQLHKYRNFPVAVVWKSEIEKQRPAIKWLSWTGGGKAEICLDLISNLNPLISNLICQGFDPTRLGPHSAQADQSGGRRGRGEGKERSFSFLTQ